MVGEIYFIEMPYSDFRTFKGRPILVFKEIDKNDILVLPLTSNLKRDGIIITNQDLKNGVLKRESVVIVPKLTAIDSSLILSTHFIAKLKNEVFEKILKEICYLFNC